MSYYGIRKLKTFQDENGKWNFSCDVYDSSIRGWNGKRVWEHLDSWFKVGLDTKEELEMFLFKNTLDGNLHGTGGKYGCIGWGNRKVKLSDKELAILNDLEKKKHDLMYGAETKAVESRLRQAGIPYAEWEQDEEYKRIHDLTSKACKEYEEFRYNTYFHRWKQHLEQKKINRRKENKRTYIVRVDYKYYDDVYIKTHGDRSTSFTNYSSNAKLFTKSIDEIKELFCNMNDTRNTKYKKIDIIDVTDFIVGKGRYRRAEIPAVEHEKHRINILSNVK